VDFGFAPGKTAEDGRVRLMFARRQNTTLIQQRRLVTLKSFIAHLKTTNAITKPVGTLLFGSHANDQGFIGVHLFPGQKGSTDFDTLVDSLSGPAKSIAIPDSLIGFTAGNPITAFFHFKGCNLGKAKPFLIKLKEALGGHVSVTAPKHFHGLTPAPPEGIFEYMCYEIVLLRNKAFPDKATAISEFQALQFPRIDGTKIPDADWKVLIPNAIGATSEVQVSQSLGTTIGKRKTILTPRQFRVNPHPYPWTLKFANAASIPKSDPDRLQALEDDLRANPKFKDDHPFPSYKRLGYQSFGDFFSGYDWTCKPNRKNLVCIGKRVKYTVVTAITDIATGDLVFNFYPNSGFSQPAMTTAIQENDSTFFETV
jgi:hypothetical protein